MIKKTKQNKHHCSVCNFFLIFSFSPRANHSFVPSCRGGRAFSAQPTSIPDKRGKGNRTQHPPPFPPLKAYELVENEQTNEQNTTVNSSQKEPTDTQNSKNTVLFFFLFFNTVVPLNGQYHHCGLSPPGVLVGGSGVVLPPPPPWRLSGTGRQLSNRLVSSAVIYYLSISQCGRKSRVRRGRGRDGGDKPEGGISQVRTVIRGTTATIRKQLETPTVHGKK